MEEIIIAHVEGLLDETCCRVNSKKKYKTNAMIVAVTDLLHGYLNSDNHVNVMKDVRYCLDYAISKAEKKKRRKK